MDFRKKLQLLLSQTLGLHNVVLFSSCRNALYTLLRSLELTNGDEVIVQSFICSTLPTAIKEAGGTVIFAEVNKNTLNLDSQDLAKKITAKTRAVIFVHTYGNPTGIKEIQEICKKNKIILIEDIAQGLFASYGGKLAGTFGDYAVYSLTKQIINIGGGAVLSNHDLRNIKRLQQQLGRNTKPNLIEYPKRLITSLYEAKAFTGSKILIDIARKKATKFKVTLNLDPHFNCSSLEAYLAVKQINSLKKKIRKRKANFEYIRKKVQTQLIGSTAESSYLYLVFAFPNSETRKKVQPHFLFLPPWQGTKISEQLLFVPNNPEFSRKKLNKLIFSYNKAFK